MEKSPLEKFEMRVSGIAQVAAHAQAILDGEVLQEKSDKERRELANVITRSNLVLLCGQFEGFLRDVCEDVVSALNEMEVEAAMLPVPTLKAVAGDLVSSSSPNSGVMFSSFVRALSAGDSFRLSPDRFSATGGNPSVETINKVFSSIGVPEVVQRLSMEHFGFDSMVAVDPQSKKVAKDLEALLGGDAALLKSALDVVDRCWAPKTKLRKVGYVGFIEELLKVRNRIAHGESDEYVTPSELIDSVESCRKFACGVVRLSDEALRGVEASRHRTSFALSYSDCE